MWQINIVVQSSAAVGAFVGATAGEDVSAFVGAFVNFKTK